jgi:hypothetical protein
VRVALVSCVKSKRDSPAPAQDLYTSQLFKEFRQYAESHADAWYILSAQHGLVEPNTVLAPYERTLNKMRTADREEWAARVKAELVSRLPAGADIIMLAGERYRAALVPFLRARVTKWKYRWKDFRSVASCSDSRSSTHRPFRKPRAVL